MIHYGGGVDELMEQGLAPSEIDRRFKCSEGLTHDCIVAEWKRDSEAAAKYRKRKGAKHGGKREQ